jgi:addiction module RelE/StbE family toxin
MQIFYSPQFLRDFERLDKRVQLKAKGKEKIFRMNPFDSRLKTHKLSGHFEGYWSFSVDYDCRIIFKFYNRNVVRFTAIGGHSIYKKSN